MINEQLECLIRQIKQLQQVVASMNKYYSLSPSNKGEIQQLLSPIFEAVRKNKINSFYQLQNKNQFDKSLEQGNNSNVFYFSKPKTAQPNHQKTVFQNSTLKSRMTNLNFYSETMKPKTTSILFQTVNSKQSSRGKDSNEKSRRKSITLQFEFEKNLDGLDRVKENRIKQRQKVAEKEKQKQKEKTRTNQKMFRVNSKVKKHLVQQIDFQQIQKMFFKKREKVTRYEHFLKTKKENRIHLLKEQKNISEPEKTIIRSSNDKPINLSFEAPSKTNHKDIEEIAKQSPTMDLKLPARKKFWIKESERRLQKEKRKNTKYPIVQGFTMKTIQH